jgi:hypothetical protein
MGKRNRRPKKVYDRRNWTPHNPCMSCGDTGPHLVEYSHTARGEQLFKASCLECGAYQKFLNEEQAKPFITADPVWLCQTQDLAPY